MKRRKRQAFIYTFLTLIFMLAAAVVVVNADRKFVVKNRPVIGSNIIISDANISLLTDRFVDNTVSYLSSNKLNTAVFHINNGEEAVADIPGFENILSGNEYFAKQDIIKQLKKALAKNKIQLYLLLDCSQISDSRLVSAVGFLAKEYNTAAIVLDNFYSDDATLAELYRATLNSKVQLVLQTDSNGLWQYAGKDIFDSFICEDMGRDQYTAVKNSEEIKENIILHHSSPSLESDIFILTNFAKLDGAIVSDYTGGRANPVLLDAILEKNENLPSFNFTVSNDFAVTYPTKDITTYYSGVFITGTARTGTVNVNGREYATATDGTFGVYYELAEGENHITVSQNGQAEQFTVTRKVYKSTGGKYEIPWDETQYLEKGRIVQTTGQLTSVLSNPDDDSAIIAGLDRGTKLVVADSVETTRSGYKTYAYRLTNGGYVLASKVEILNEITADYQPDEDMDISDFSIYETPVITAVLGEKLGNGDELIVFNVNNNPAVISSFADDKLSLLFMNTTTDILKIHRSEFYNSHTIVEHDNGVELTLALNEDNPLWGYDVKTEDGKVTLYLKHTPKLASGSNPLQGITIMLDAGHGDTDSGALGVAAVNGPLEKDLNLAVAQATKAVLQQYGATVLMTREDDTFLTLDERRNLVRSEKPDLFIAVHHNSMDYSYNSTNARGSECYYFTRQSENLANLMCENISAATGRYNRGANTGYFYVTRTDIAPSVLMEYSFIINPNEFAKTYSDTDIYKAAVGTVQAVLKAIPK